MNATPILLGPTLTAVADQGAPFITRSLPLDALCELLDELPDEARSVRFYGKSDAKAVELYWLDPEGNWRLFGQIPVDAPEMGTLL